MKPEIMRYVSELLKRTAPVTGRVLDVGSLNVNGSVKSLFTQCSEYIGLDMRLGPDVDVVAKADSIPYDNDYFDCVVCCEMLEHDDNFFKSLEEMKRVLKSGGYLILTVPGIGFKIHNYPSDYWRFTPFAMELMLKGFHSVEVWSGSHDTLCGFGIK